MFGLMGLLIAFTFSGAASRFDARRELIVEEANAIGTAWLRLDLLDADQQPAIRKHVSQLLRRAARDLPEHRRPGSRAARTYAESLRPRERVLGEAVAAAHRRGLAAGADPARPRPERDVRHRVDADDATQMHPPMRHLRDALCAHAGRVAARGLRDGGRQAAELATHARLLARDGGFRVHHSRPRVSTPGSDPNRRLRRRAGGPAQELWTEPREVRARDEFRMQKGGGSCNRDFECWPPRSRRP